MSDLSKLNNDGPQQAVPATDPVMIAWEAYKQSPAYANSRKWAQHESAVDGSLWAAFSTGFRHATELAKPKP